MALRFLGNIARLLFGPIWLGRRWLARRSRAGWVVVRLRARVAEFRPRSTLLRRLLERAPDLRASSLEELRKLVDAMSQDASIRGLVLHVPGIDAGWATCESLRGALLGLRAAGKEVVCYLPQGGGNRELYVALAADRIFAGPYTAFGPLGLSARPLYLRPLLDRFGVEVQVQACGEYKSAAEPALRDTLSAPAREQLEALLLAMQRALEQALAARGLNPQQVGALFQRGLLRASEALELRIVDGILYPDELGACIEREPPPHGASAPAALMRKFVSAETYLQKRPKPLWRPLRRPPFIAVLPLRGTIAGEGGGLSRGGIRHAPIAAALRALGDDSGARAVVLFIDSPGGSAHASELIHREVLRLAARKPVVACFGDVAASGGYYIASACRRVVAQPLTITGSIGVISAKVAAGKLLDQLGARPQLVRTAPHADMASLVRTLTPEEDALMRAHADELYARFLTVVANGRQRPVAEIEPLARGRVWIGSDAHERKLVDVLGGLPRAVDEARAALTDLSGAERAALEPRLHHARTGRRPPQPGPLDLAFDGDAALRADLPGLDRLCARPASDLLTAVFEALPDFEIACAARREAFHYYLPFLSGFQL